LQVKRLEAHLSFKPRIPHKTRQRLQTRIHSLLAKPHTTKLNNKHINDKALLPQLNYNTQAEPLWR
jgi:hypothetical protein